MAETAGFDSGWEGDAMSTLASTGRIRPRPERKEEKLAACSGSLSLTPEDRAELLAILARDPDPSVAERAQNALLSQPIEGIVKALERADCDVALFQYCSENLAARPAMADLLAKNAACPAMLLAPVAAHLTPLGIQALVDDLERFCEAPSLVDTILLCSTLSSEQRALLEEFKKGPLSQAELEQAVGEVENIPAKRETLMQRLARMTVVERLTLALKGGRTERLALIHDPNKLVQRCVLQSPRLTDSEVESFAAMTNLSTEVLRTISLMRIYVKNYAIVKNLVNNSKTPLDVSLHLFPRLTSTDLFKLTSNKNVPETLRSSALKLHRKRKLNAG